MNTKFLSHFMIILIAVMLTSCGPPDLSREEAAKLIESHTTMNRYKSELLLQSNAVEQGVAMGWWQKTGWGDQVTNLSPAILSEASTIDGGDLVLKKPVGISVTVTGIAGDKNQTRRAVEFEWRYKDLPPLSRRIAIEGGKGDVVLQRYDDGWRITDYDFTERSPSPFPLSDQEKQDVAKDIAAVREKRAAAEKVAAEAKRQFDESLRLASTPTHVISRHTLDATHGTWGAMKVNFTVTDVSVQVQEQLAVERLQRNASAYEIFFARVLRPNVPASSSANLDGYLAISRMSISIGRDQKNSPQLLEIINAINQAFSSWQSKHAQVVSDCAKSNTWGCLPAEK